MRIFIGSSGEQRRLVEYMTDFMRKEFGKKLEPVPWTVPWAGSMYTLENLLAFVDSTDGAILFWTADDKTWYRDTVRHEPRDNLVFEAGLFIATHGRARTQLMVPKYQEGDERTRAAVPSDVQGLTWNQYAWAEGDPEATGLPRAARTVCERLVALGPRTRTTTIVDQLSAYKTKIEEVRTVVGDWATISVEGIQRLAEASPVSQIDILASYRVGEIRRVLDTFRHKKAAKLRACFANMWDEALLAAYCRKYTDRTRDHIHAALKESIGFLLGKCSINVRDSGEVLVTDLENPPAADYQIRLTGQRITFGYYRIDSTSFLVPLDMKKAQNPAPLAWVLSQETMPKTFDAYSAEFHQMFEEAVHVYPSRV